MSRLKHGDMINRFSSYIQDQLNKYECATKKKSEANIKASSILICLVEYIP